MPLGLATTASGFSDMGLASTPSTPDVGGGSHLCTRARASPHPSEPDLLAAAIGPQDGLLLEDLLVGLPDLLDQPAAFPPRLVRVEEDQQHGALLDGDPGGAAELSEAGHQREAVGKSRGDTLVEELLELGLADDAIRFRRTEEQLGAGEALPDEALLDGRSLEGEAIRTDRLGHRAGQCLGGGTTGH